MIYYSLIMRKLTYIDRLIKRYSNYLIPKLFIGVINVALAFISFLVSLLLPHRVKEEKLYSEIRNKARKERS